MRISPKSTASTQKQRLSNYLIKVRILAQHNRKEH